jgi:hypothetical protein
MIYKRKDMYIFGLATLSNIQVNDMELINAKELNRMGKSWFVLYKYYELEDKNVLEWQNCKTVVMRKNIYERTRQYHLEWLKYIIFAYENKLETNKMGAYGFDITTMACIIYDKLTGKDTGQET